MTALAEDGDPPPTPISSDTGVESEKAPLDPSIAKSVEGSALLHARAESYSEGVDALCQELFSMNQAVREALAEGFSGASLASQLMAAEDAAARDVVAAGTHATPLSASRRGLRGQRKPGAQLLWGGVAGAPPGTTDAGADPAPREAAGVGEQDAQVAGADAEAPDGDVELAGSSLLVLFQEQQGGEGLAADGEGAQPEIGAIEVEEATRAEGKAGKAGGEGAEDSRSASRASTRAASTRPNTTAAADQGEGSRGGSVATRPQTRAESVLEEEVGGGAEQEPASGHDVGKLGAESAGADEGAGGAVAPPPPGGGGGGGGQGPIGTADGDTREYEEAREELVGFLRENTAEGLAERTPGNPCGLRNQGSTCYLNSLLQSLYQVPEFRSFALSWNSEQADGGGGAAPPESACIPSQLRALFADMHSSRRSAVSTEGLTRSFGWGSAAAFQQHDCSELLHILFEALGKASGERFGGVRSLFEGVSVSYIGSEERGVWRGRDEPFLGLQLQVEGIRSVEDAVKAYVEPEVLEGDNMWRLDDGSMVAAVKGLFPKSLPPILVFDLKRFKYGASGREKVDSPQSIAPELDLGDILQRHRPAHVGNVLGEGAAPLPSGGCYDIQAILLHRGTAMGGHYSCALREWEGAGGVLGRWLHFNDSVVSEVPEADVQSLLERGSFGGEQRAGQKHGRESTAYMLFYRRRGMPVPAGGSLAPQGEVLRRVVEGNDRLARLHRLLTVHESLCEVRVFLPGGQEAAVAVRLPKARALADATAEVRRRLLHGGARDGLEGKLGRSDCECRLRRFDVFSGSLGETFGGREERSLEELGLAPACMLLFEARGVGEEEFAEHDDWTFRVGRWMGGAQGGDGVPARWERVTIRRGEGATVGALRGRAMAVLGLAAESDASLVVCGERGQGCLALDGEDAPLEASGARRGAEIVVDCGGASQALDFYRSLESKAEVSFNHPSRPDSSPFTLHADVRWTIHLAKMAEMLGVEADTIHLRRSARSAQLKDESATLASVGVSHGSSLFVGQGAPRGEGQVLLKVFLGTGGGGVKSLVQVTVDEKDTVAGLKKQLAARISKMREPPPGWSGDASLIRVRDKKGKEVGKILCDDSTLRKALPRLTDGKEIVLQMLSAPETVTESSILVQVRLWDVETDRVCAPTEMVISKTSSCDELRELIRSAMPEVCSEAADAAGAEGPAVVDNSPSTEAASVRVGLAKASAFGPPLDAAAVGRLKWNDPKAEGKAVCEAPWSLRDGSIVVARDEQKFAKRPPPCEQPGKGARVAAASARQQHDSEVRVGGGREKGITISVWGEDGGGPERRGGTGEQSPAVAIDGSSEAVPKGKGVAFDVVF